MKIRIHISPLSNRNITFIINLDLINIRLIFNSFDVSPLIESSKLSKSDELL